MPLMATSGFGIDVVDVKRFARFRLSRDHRFLTDTFSRAEIEYCYSFTDPAPHLAGTFAAKEAVFKALERGDILLSSIEIRRSKSGAPGVFVSGRVKKAVLVSISHTATLAVAAAIRRS